MESKSDRGTARKHQILEAASNVFARLGLQKTRMDDIVSESGLSKGALYWYFKSKDDIIVAILERFLERELEVLSALPEAEGSAEDRLRKFSELIVADLRNLKYFQTIAYEFYAMALRKKSIRALFKVYLKKYLNIMVPIAEQGIRNGEFKEMDPSDIAVSMGAIVEGTILIYGFDPEFIDLERHIRVGMDLLLAGIKNPNNQEDLEE